MLYLVTGANGAGKTLNTLKWVRERQIKEGRPVCHNGRFEPVENGELSTWKKIDIQNWQDEPDGTIFLVDECHNDFPLRAPSSKPPEYVQMLAEHRRRGFDFYLITQHPQNIDAFVRRLIGSPGWHRHLKRAFGGDLVSCAEYPAVNAQCEKQGAGKDAEVKMLAFPREVFGWYKSASLHTGKRKIPRSVFVLVACAIIVPLLIWFAFSRVAGKVLDDPAKGDPSMRPAVLTAQDQQQGQQLPSPEVSRMAYLESRLPRLGGMPQSAPIYDKITEPVTAPYPAACVNMPSRGGCRCYSQQATRIDVPMAMCLEIVAKGYFLDWEAPEHQRAREQLQQAQDQAREKREKAAELAEEAKRNAVLERPFPKPEPNLPGQITQADIKHQGLALRNPAMAAIAAGNQNLPLPGTNRGPMQRE